MTLARRSLLPLLWLLLAAALLLRAAMPTGWMPTVQQGWMRIAICTGMGPAFLTLGTDGRLQKDAPKPAAPRDPCPFGLAAAQPADLPPAIELPAPPARLDVLVSRARAQAAAIARRGLRPPARGPPKLA